MVAFGYGNLSVGLRSPDFNNMSSLSLRRIQRNTPGLDLVIYRDPTWSFTEEISLEFSFIEDSTVAQLKLFLRATLGLIVQFVDHEGQSWPVMVKTPNIEVKKAGRSNNTFEMKLEVIFIQ